MLYPDRPFLERFEAAARDGFEAVEYLFPYAWPASTLSRLLQDWGLQQVLLNTPAGGQDSAQFVCAWDRGDRGTACVPGRQAEFQAGILAALQYAKALDCPRIHAMVGLRASGCSVSEADDTLVRNLTWAARMAGEEGRELLIEPINTRNVPGFHLNRQDHAHAVLAAVASPHLKVQMDLYHCQVVEGDLCQKISQYLPTGQVGHIQVADVPLRHEPGTGEVHWPHVFAHLDTVAQACGWQGWVGCEYTPSDTTPGGTSRGMSWKKAYQSGLKEINK